MEYRHGSAIGQKNEMIRAFLAALSRSNLKNHLVLVGGVAMAYAYGSPRMTKDIDFLLSPNGQSWLETVTAMTSFLRQAPKVTPDQKLVRWKLRKMTNRHPLVVPIELACARAQTARPFLIERETVFTCKATELLSEKVLATLSRWKYRRSVKWSDLFDIGYLRLRVGAPDPDPLDLTQKASDYEMCLPEKEDVKHLIDHIKNAYASFEKSLKKMLHLPDSREYFAHSIEVLDAIYRKMA